MSNSISIKDLIPAYAFHPGEFLDDELIARNIKPVDFAMQIGMDVTELNNIINGKQNVTNEIALILENGLQIDASFWLNSQKSFEVNTIRIRERDLLKRK